MPKFRQKLFNFVFGELPKTEMKQDGGTSTSSDPAGYGTGLYGFKEPETRREEFLKNIRGWTFANINAIADSIGFMQLKLYEMSANGETKEVLTHPILDNLNRVNEFTTKFDHFWLTAAYLEAVGEAPWFLDKDNSGEIIGIYYIDPTKLKPVPDKENNRLIGYWEFTTEKGGKINIPLDQIVPLRQLDPANPVRGLGTMEAAVRSIDIDNSAEKWNYQFFKNNASPGVKFKVDTKNLTKEQKSKIKNNIESQYKGVEKSQQLWVLFDGMDVESFGTAPKDMDWNAQQQWLSDKIRGIFRVPKAIMAQTEGVNFASANVAIQTFREFTIKPKMERIIEQLNEFYVPQFKGAENMFLDFVDPVEEDADSKLKRYENGTNNYWLTINEIRAQEDLASIGPAGDQVYIPINLIGTSVKIVPEKQVAPEARFRQVKARVKPTIDKKAIEDKLANIIKNDMLSKRKSKEEKKKEEPKEETKPTSPRQFSQEQKDAFWKMKDIVFNKFLPRMKQKASRVFTEQEEDVLKALNNNKDLKVNVNKILLDKNNERVRTLEVFTPIVTSLMKDSGDVTLSFLGLSMSFDATEEFTQNYIKSRTIKFADASTEATNKAIKATFFEGIELGESTTLLSKRVANVFNKARDFRSDRISRSETTRFNVEATEEAYIQSGIVEGKEWIVNPGACPYCLNFLGRTTKLGGTFADKGDTVRGEDSPNLSLDYEDIEHPPLHVNCRCDIIPILGNKGLTDTKKEIIFMNKEIREKNSKYFMDIEHSHAEHKENIAIEVKEGIEKAENSATKKVVDKIDEVMKDD